MPNFFIIGAARCATDSLYSYLNQHPQIYMSPVKETNWFVFYGQPVQFCGPGDREALQSCYVPTLGAYQAQFDGVRDEQAIGEASPWYIYRPEVPARIKSDVPDARFIAMLRNPIDRAYSSFAMLTRDCREPESQFMRAIELEDERVAANWEPIWHYARMGCYHDQVKRYFDTFGRDRVRVYIYDDFDSAPADVMADILRFLEVDAGFLPDMTVRLNQSYVPKSRALHGALAGGSPLKAVSRRLVPAPLRSRIRASAMASNAQRGGVTAEERARLIEVFRSDVERLQELLNRDLSIWLSA